MDDLTFLARLLRETNYSSDYATASACVELDNRRIVMRNACELLDQLERLEKRLEQRGGLDIPSNVLTWLDSLHSQNGAY